MRKIIALLALGAFLLASCRDADETLPSPTTEPTESPTPLRATPTPEPIRVSLSEALSSEEELPATRQLSEPVLYYAYKEGTHVSVFRRDITTGEEELILEYTEAYEAEHSGNSWAEQVPSVGLDKTNGLLVFASDTDLASFDLESGKTRTLLRRTEGTSFGDRMRYRWLTESGHELCCAFGLAVISVGPAGRATIRTVHFEGSGLASFATDGSDLCLFEKMNGSSQPQGGRDWSADGALADGNADAAYSEPGLFVASSTHPCSERELAENLPGLNGNAGLQDPSWSDDGNWIVATERSSFDPGAREPVVRIKSDDTVAEVLVPDGVNAWPLFSPDGSFVYFSQGERLNDQGVVTDWRIKTVDVLSHNESEAFDLPAGWSGQLRGWTEEGYLILGLQASEPYAFYGSSKSRVAIVDPEDGNVIYMSGQRDFTNYLGFVPE